MRRVIKLASDTINREDVNALCEWLMQEPLPKLTQGELVKEYERQYANNAGTKYAVFVNSGSSANFLVAFAAKQMASGKPLSVVIPSVGWATTISPWTVLGFDVTVCDVNMDDLSVDLNHLQRIFQKQKPTYLFLVCVLGIPPKMDEIAALCAKYGVMLLLDNCEGQGAVYKGMRLEQYAYAATSSSYFGHITSTIEGGVITTDDEDLYNFLKLVRSHGWNRDLDDNAKLALRKKYHTTKFNEFYTFIEQGFNFRNTEIGAFFGLRQLERLNDYVEKRGRVLQWYYDYLPADTWKPTIPNTLPHEPSYPALLGYPILSEKREEIIEALRGNNVECRPLVSGNLAMHPAFQNLHNGKCGDLPNATRIHEYGLYVPAHQDLTESDIQFVCEIVNRFTT